jgi:glutamyl-Q tRNA(Asp) synthetase
MTTASPQKVFRFAPSPNGYLHLGHAYSAMLNFEMARLSGGRFLLRIEDIDLDRTRAIFETAIYEDLAWLGLAWEEPVRRQSEHFGDYEAALERLAAQSCLFPCFCSRSDVARRLAGRAGWPRDPDGAPLYPGTCKGLSAAEVEARLAAGQNAARRLNSAQALGLCAEPLGWLEYGGEARAPGPRDVHAEPGVWGDVLLARKDVPTSYAIAVVVDDALQGVTDVVRGLDLLAATSLHRLLQFLLDLPAPRYHHHKLLLNELGQKLSKSASAKSLRALRAEGVTPADIRRQLGFR